MNENELTASDIFATTVSKTIKKVEENIEKTGSVPIGYIPVNFACGNKLNVSVLHFRNYTMEELLELASSTEENQFNVLIKKVLNKMVFEKFDCSELHAEQVKQVLFTIYLNFWNKSLFKVPYYKEEGKDEIAYTDIDITALDVIDINEKFKEPFTVVGDSGLTVKFILPRVKHIFLTDAFIKEYYKEQEAKFTRIKKVKALVEKMEKSDDESVHNKIADINITPEEEESYNEFITEKGKMYLCVLESQLIHSINGVEINTIEEKIEAFKSKIDISFWFDYKDIVQDYGTFGISDKYTFTNESGEKITRGFSFRLTDFIPAVEQKTNRKYVVQFDDWI